MSAEAVLRALVFVELRVLCRTALALHMVVHAVQRGFQHHANEDLRRAVTVMPMDDRRPVADLAARLGIPGILGSGLRRHAVGAGSADGLALPGLSQADSRFWMLSAPRGSASLTDFRAVPTLRAKVQRICWTLLPGPAKVRYVSRLPDAHGYTLLLAYAPWGRDLAPAIASAVRFVRGPQQLAMRGGDC